MGISVAVGNRLGVASPLPCETAWAVAPGAGRWPGIDGIGGIVGIGGMPFPVVVGPFKVSVGLTAMSPLPPFLVMVGLTSTLDEPPFKVSVGLTAMSPLPPSLVMVGLTSTLDAPPFEVIVGDTSVLPLPPVVVITGLTEMPRPTLYDRNVPLAFWTTSGLVK